MILTLPKPFSPIGIISQTGQLVCLHIISCPQSYAAIQVQCQQPIWGTNIESPFSPGVVEVVPANGSKVVALDTDVNDKTDFVGGFSIFYNAEDGSQQKYNSPVFQVLQDTGETSPVTYNQQALSTSLVASGTHSTRQATPTKRINIRFSHDVSFNVHSNIKTIQSRPSLSDKNWSRDWHNVRHCGNGPIRLFVLEEEGEGEEEGLGPPKILWDVPETGYNCQSGADHGRVGRASKTP